MLLPLPAADAQADFVRVGVREVGYRQVLRCSRKILATGRYDGAEINAQVEQADGVLVGGVVEEDERCLRITGLSTSQSARQASGTLRPDCPGKF